MRFPAVFAVFAVIASIVTTASVVRADEDDWDDPKPAAARSSHAPALQAPAAEAPAEPEDERAIFRRLERQLSLGPRGTIARADVSATVKQHIGEIRYCFARAQQRNPGVSGRIAVRFVVGLAGEVLGAAVESSTVEDEPTERCVVGAVRRWSFPAAQIAPVVLTHPFTVTPL